MKYFALIDELFDFKYVLTEEVLNDLPKALLENNKDVSVYTTITSELDPESESRLRNDRNTALYHEVIRSVTKSEPLTIEDVNDIWTIVDKVNEQKREIDTVITNSAVGTRLVDHPKYEVAPQQKDSLISGSPYYVGHIGNVRIIIDPYMAWKDTRMFFYSKKNIQVAVYIKSMEVKAEAAFAPSAKTVLSAYIYNEKPIDVIDIKVPVEEII
jgi:hypothetical protein